MRNTIFYLWNCFFSSVLILKRHATCDNNITYTVHRWIHFSTERKQMMLIGLSSTSEDFEYWVRLTYITSNIFFSVQNPLARGRNATRRGDVIIWPVLVACATIFIINGSADVCIICIHYVRERFETLEFGNGRKTKNSSYHCAYSFVTHRNQTWLPTLV